MAGAGAVGGRSTVKVGGRSSRILRAEEYEALRRREDGVVAAPAQVREAPLPPRAVASVQADPVSRLVGDWAQRLFVDALEDQRTVRVSHLLRGFVR